MSEQNKLYYADYLRVLATLAVIFLHSAGDLLYHFKLNDMDLTRWWTGNIYDSVVRWCVPVFVMLSGALLLYPTKPESIPTFLRKRLLRVAIPFVFWAFVYAIYTFRAQTLQFQMPYLPDVFEKVFFQDAYFHLWFVPMIMGLYLLTPVFRVFVRHATRFEIEYFLIFWFYVSTIQIYFPHFIIIKYIGWLAYIGYLVLGDYLHRFPISAKNTTLIYRLGWLSLIITIWGTWQTSAHFGYFSDSLYLYLSPNVIFMAVALFLWAKNYDWVSFSNRNLRVAAAVKWFSGISFGVYLVHVLLMDILKNGYCMNIIINGETFLGRPITPIMGVWIYFFITVFLSTIIIFLLKKIPYLRDWIG
jgi:surface polysaccharide O-acyltransferase-like enzyme